MELNKVFIYLHLTKVQNLYDISPLAKASGN